MVTPKWSHFSTSKVFDKKGYNKKMRYLLKEAMTFHKHCASSWTHRFNVGHFKNIEWCLLCNIICDWLHLTWFLVLLVHQQLSYWLYLIKMSLSLSRKDFIYLLQFNVEKLYELQGYFYAPLREINTITVKSIRNKKSMNICRAKSSYFHYKL